MKKLGRLEGWADADEQGRYVLFVFFRIRTEPSVLSFSSHSSSSNDLLYYKDDERQLQQFRYSIIRAAM
jgi:hypothetical protein